MNLYRQKDIRLYINSGVRPDHSLLTSKFILTYLKDVEIKEAQK
jgi:hypothetical protein